MKIYAKDSKFELYQSIKDVVSGFEGIIMAISEYHNGAIHYGIASRKLKDDGSVREWEWFDETRCKFIKAEDEELQITIRKPKFKMFDKLEDSVSGFRGQVLCITFFATGCIKYSIAPNILTKDGTIYEWNSIDESLLVCKEESKKEKATKSFGGPDKMKKLGFK